MTISDIYKGFRGFYQSIEEDYSDFHTGTFEWETLHLRYLIYYLLRYGIQDMQYFTYYHYRTAYRLYVEKLVCNEKIMC